MHILIAPDKFKDALIAQEAAEAIEKGIKRAFPFNPGVSTQLLPLADGGEGTAEILTRLNKGVTKNSTVMGPLKNQIQAQWGCLPGKKKAFIELAQASGLHLIPREDRNPLLTTTFGTGQMVAAALESGAKEIILGIGGSATNDGGTGMAAALGVRFMDSGGREIPFPSGKDLSNIRSIDRSSLHPSLESCKIQVACDVDNLLLGPEGATYTFAPQKGADEQMLPMLEDGLQNLSQIIQKDLGIEINLLAGGGAAGGTGAGIVAFLEGKLCNGAELILKHSRFNQHLKKADLVITGEGKIDSTSLGGKLISRLCEKARQAKIPVVAFCGKSELSEKQIDSSGLMGVISISDKENDLETALRNSSQNLEEAVYEYFLMGQAY